MGIKKAKKLIDYIRRNPGTLGDKINYLQLEEILEAYNEPDEQEGSNVTESNKQEGSQ